ncbi:MAG: hypothetical protein IK108_05915 [Clostridia bacterium]|nr:hypothetical protein [Clostridia bacterium]
MLNDAIRMIAAAVCCDQKRISIPVTPHQALGSVNLLLLQLAAHSEISEAGEAHITVIPRTPDVSAPRFGTLPRELFFLFAGLCAELNLVLQVNAVEEGVSEDELDALSRALDGVLVYAIKKDRILLSSFTSTESPDPEIAVPEAFAAGLLLGACMSERDTVFRLERYMDMPAVQTAVRAINEFGGSAEETDGSLTVHTLRGRFDEKTGRRIKKKDTQCS